MSTSRTTAEPIHTKGPSLTSIITRLRLPLAVLVLLLAAPATSQAAGLLEATGGDGDTLEFRGAADIENNVTVSGNVPTTPGGDTIATITDTADVIDVEPDLEPICTGEGTNTVVCNDFFEFWDIFLGSDDDTFVATGSLILDVDGEEGDDRLTGSDVENEEEIEGGTGGDTILGRGGDDRLRGEADVDTVDGGAGADEIEDEQAAGSDIYRGGTGIDQIDYDSFGDPENIAVDLTSFAARSNPAERDSMSGVEDIDIDSDDPGNDIVNGDASGNAISTNVGNDQVNPRAGSDLVETEEGNDSVDTRDGFFDRVDCGAGVDTAQADQFDVLEGCETVARTAVRAVGADLVAPTCTVTQVRRTLGRKGFFRGFRPLVACNEAATLEISLVANVRRGKLISSRVGDIVLAQTTVAAGAAAPRIKPAKRFARQLSKRRGFRARLVVEASDQFGNTKTATKTIKVKKAPKPKRKRRARR